jgi:hypothetical protein
MRCPVNAYDILNAKIALFLTVTLEKAFSASEKASKI